MVYSARLRPQGGGHCGASGAALFGSWRARALRRRPHRFARSRRRLMDGRTTLLDHADTAQMRDTAGRAAPTRGKLIWRLAIMAVLLAVVFGGFYAYERFRETMTAQFFANMKPPPVPVVAVAATAQSLPQSFGGIGSLIAVHQVTVSPEIGGRITKIFFEAGATVRAGDPLVQLNDEPEQGDLLNYRAQARLAQINLTRARELAARQNGP